MPRATVVESDTGPPGDAPSGAESNVGSTLVTYASLCPGAIDEAAIQRERAWFAEMHDLINRLVGMSEGCPIGDGWEGSFAIATLSEQMLATYGSGEDPESEPTKRRKRRVLGRSAYLAAAGVVCVRCGSNRALVLDHVIPLARGGADDASNLQPLCRDCNTLKGSRLESEIPEW